MRTIFPYLVLSLLLVWSCSDNNDDAAVVSMLTPDSQSVSDTSSPDADVIVQDDTGASLDSNEPLDIELTPDSNKETDAEQPSDSETKVDVDENADAQITADAIPDADEPDDVPTLTDGEDPKDLPQDSDDQPKDTNDKNDSVADAKGAKDVTEKPDTKPEPPITPVVPGHWRSSIYPEDWSPDKTDDQGRFVHDFSYAGYYRGEKPIPTDIPGMTVSATDPQFGADPVGSEDSTAAIQAALDHVGENGGGVVLLPAGTYKIKPPKDSDHALWMRHSNVVLRGAGKDATFLYNADYMMRNKAVIRVAPPKGGSWSSSGGPGTTLTKDAKNRASELTVKDGKVFEAGQWVVVAADVGDDWVKEHNMADLWTQKILGGLRFMRQLTKVEGNVLTIDIPLRYPVKVIDKGRVYPAIEQLHDIGIEDISLGMVEHPGKSGWGDNDYKTEGKSAYEVHGADLIRVNLTRDSWIQRVSSYYFGANKGMHHMLSDGIVLAMSRGISVLDTAMHYPQYEGGGGNGYGFVLQGSDNLIKNCTALSTRHGYSFKKMYSNGNVLVHSSSSNSRLATDFHMHLSMANLLDSMVFEADFIDATYRPYGTAHGYTTTQTMLWNNVGLSPLKNNLFVVDSRQYKWGLVVGTQGANPAIKTTPLTDTKDTSPEDFAEGEGAGGSLQPASLYADQLYRRLNANQPKPIEVPLLSVNASADTYVRSGTSKNDNFGTDSTLRIKDSSGNFSRRAFVQFSLNEITTPVMKATLNVYGYIADQGGDETTLFVDSVSDNTWDETKMTWDSQPEADNYLAKAHVTKAKQWITLDVTSYVRWRIENGKNASFRLSQNLAGQGLQVIVNSREADSKQPTLEIVPHLEKPLSIASIVGTTGDNGTWAKDVADNNLATTWSTQGSEAWVRIDLGGVKLTSSLGLILPQSDKRIAYFEIKKSMDAKNWTSIATLQTDGRTKGRQIFSWPPTSAHYVKIVAYGNSDDALSEISELSIYGP